MFKNQVHLFFDNARKGRNHWSIYVFVLISCIFGGSLFATILFENFNIPASDRNRTLAAMLIPFSWMVLILVVGTQFLHKRPWISLFNTLDRIRWSKFLWAFLVWFGLAGISDLVLCYGLGWEYKFEFEIGNYILLLLISMSLIPVQCLAEELFFRSYLPQGVYNWKVSVWLSVLASCVFFVLMHGANPENEKYGYLVMAIYYFVFSLFLSWLVFRDNGIEQAWGIHTATNFYGATMVGYEGSALQTDALFHIASQDGLTMLGVTLAFILVYIPLGHFLISDPWIGSKIFLKDDSNKISADL